MNERQIASLYHQWGPVVYRRCLGVLKDREEARDATQQVFVQLLRHAARFEGDPTTAIAWMQSVAVNVSLNRRRDGLLRASKLERFPEPTPTSPAPDEALERRELLEQVLARSDEPSRDLAISVLVEEQTHQDAATRLGVSSKTIQRRLQQFIERARRLIRRGEP